MTKDGSLARLASYKRAIDADIVAYADYLRANVRQQYGDHVAEAEAEVFLDILARGGKRIRGGLVMAGYEMCGGTIDLNLGASGLDAGAVFSASSGENGTNGTVTEQRSRKTAASAKSGSGVASSAGEQAAATRSTKMIVQAARAIEMLHAYMLIIDDIQDRSALRRGQPSAHKMVEAWHKEHKLKGDAAHAGISLALSAAIAGAHGAQAILANLDADPELRLKAISITNRTMAITAHGQTLDILNELVAEPSEEDIERVLEWKTALYTVINPLHVGMVLAGADCRATDAITPYGRHAGKAFQITDDILGIYGDEKELGKTPGDDIREGKGTLLVLYASKHAAPADRIFLQKALGNPNLTPEEFETCKQIIQNSGALAYARKTAAKHLTQALVSLDRARGLWSQEGADFLKGLAAALQNRAG